MIDIVNKTNLKSVGEHDDKEQIILTNTFRDFNNYLTSLETRFNGEYDKIPHYVITRGGVIYKLLKDNQYSNFYNSEKVNKKSIFISLENLGWLEKEPLKEHYINWIGDIYNGNVYKKKWRDYYFWEPYKEEQINSLYLLLKELTNNLEIEFKSVGHNTLINKVEKYGGIVSLSNFNDRFTGVNPSFDFELLLNKIENE